MNPPRPAFEAAGRSIQENIRKLKLKITRRRATLRRAIGIRPGSRTIRVQKAGQRASFRQRKVYQGRTSRTLRGETVLVPSLIDCLLPGWKAALWFAGRSLRPV